MQPVQIFLHKGTYSQKEHAHSFRGKALSLHPLYLFLYTEGSLQKSTCQYLQGRGIWVVTTATIHASQPMTSRNTCCSILERNPLPAISAASLAGGQADWNITCFPTLVRNALLARSVNTHAGSFSTSRKRPFLLFGALEIDKRKIFFCVKN